MKHRLSLATIVAPALTVVTLAACGGEAHRTASSSRAQPAPPPIVAEGETVLVDSGCLACHTIGGQGNNQPGPDLSAVGARLSPAGIARALRDARPPMPSFRDLPRHKFEAIVAYLTLLRPGNTLPRPVVP